MLTHVDKLRAAATSTDLRHLSVTDALCVKRKMRCDPIWMLLLRGLLAIEFFVTADIIYRIKMGLTWGAQNFLSVSTICTKFILSVYSNSPRLELEAEFDCLRLLSFLGIGFSCRSHFFASPILSAYRGFRHPFSIHNCPSSFQVRVPFKKGNIE